MAGRNPAQRRILGAGEAGSGLWYLAVSAAAGMVSGSATHRGALAGLGRAWQEHRGQLRQSLRQPQVTGACALFHFLDKDMGSIGQTLGPACGLLPSTPLGIQLQVWVSPDFPASRAARGTGFALRAPTPKQVSAFLMPPPGIFRRGRDFPGVRSLSGPQVLGLVLVPSMKVAPAGAAAVAADASRFLWALLLQEITVLASLLQDASTRSPRSHSRNVARAGLGTGPWLWSLGTWHSLGFGPWTCASPAVAVFSVMSAFSAGAPDSRPHPTCFLFPPWAQSFSGSTAWLWGVLQAWVTLCCQLRSGMSGRKTATTPAPRGSTWQAPHELEEGSVRHVVPGGADHPDYDQQPKLWSHSQGGRGGEGAGESPLLLARRQGPALTLLELVDPHPLNALAFSPWTLPTRAKRGGPAASGLDSCLERPRGRSPRC